MRQERILFFIWSYLIDYFKGKNIFFNINLYIFSSIIQQERKRGEENIKGRKYRRNLGQIWSSFWAYDKGNIPIHKYFGNFLNLLLYN